MSLRFRKSCLNLAVLAALGFSVPAMAQSTSSGILGQVQDASGAVISDATITILHVPSNTKSVINSNESGRFTAKGLRVGGPYTVTVKSSNGERVFENVFLSLGKNTELDVEIGSVFLEEMQVVGVYEDSGRSSGPSSTFSSIDLQNTPAIDRDLKDVIRADPRIYIDENNENAIQCAGANPRFNSLTVDGVRLSDNFGLNGSGYPTERAPFPFDAIDQVSVELAPYDVQYGGFSACNINAVTKAGGNEVHGSMYIDYTNDSLTADSLEGDDRLVDSFSEKRIGFTVGGPIIEDELFFFVAADKIDGVNTFNRGAEDSNAGSPVTGVTQADIDEISRIANDIYGYDPGGIPSSIPIDDERLLVKLDWNINDFHRATFTYNYNKGTTINEADGDADELEFTGHLYESETELNNYVGQLFSDWSDTFSTEFKLGYSKVDNSQTPLGDSDFGEVQIRVGDATVYLGSDDSRHANKLKYDTLNFKAAGTWLLDRHTISFGFEHERLDVFNLFIQEAEGEYRFASIADFEAGTVDRIIYENATETNVPADASASFVYTIDTLYVQDKFEFDSIDLSITGGLRYDRYGTNDAPTLNEEFTEVYGFSNQATVDGLGLLQPRFGLEWSVNDELDIRAGVGLYSGGNPNVWLSNNYSNNGVTQLENNFFNDDLGSISILDPSFAFTGEGRPIYDVPQDLFDLVEAGEGSQGGVNLLDPDFKLPSIWKYSVGGSWFLPSNVVATADVLYSKNRNSVIISDISLEENTDVTNPDGRTSYIRTNGRSEDFMLTNIDGDSGSSTVISLGVSKLFESGIDVAVGYAFTEAKDVNPMPSSVAFSNYTNIATADPENPGVATSNYEIPHRITLKVGYTAALFGDYETKFNLFGSANEGRPYSYTFTDGGIFGDAVGGGNPLLYVPTGADDPNVVFTPYVEATDNTEASGFDSEAFFAWADSEGLSRGEIMDRNELNSDWWIKFDLRIEQELPGFTPDHSASAFMVIENFGNLLNDDWGVAYETSFPRAQDAVRASINDAGQYVFEEFLDPNGPTRETDASSWEIRVGVSYDF